MPLNLSVTAYGDPANPVLVLGPSLGTSAASLWGACADQLADRFHVLAWDLPGHGDSEPATGFTVADLAEGVLAAVGARRFRYAGDSIGGAVGLALLLDAPERVESAILLCTGAKIGDPEGWHERAATVRAEGTAALVDGSVQRWFAPGFPERDPKSTEALTAALRATDDESYAAACEALAGFDVRDRLAEIHAPVLAVAGRYDTPTPVESLRAIADGIPGARLAVVGNAAHLVPAEDPDRTVELIVAGPPATPQAGMATRRAVLGDAHVDRASAATTEFTADFQKFITEYAWGGIWTRPGLAARDRSLITLSAMVALGHHDEFAMHVRAARRNGVTVAEIRELLLQTAVYCGVPAANTAFKIAQGVLDELTETDLR